MGLARRLYDDFHVLAKGGEEVHEAFNRKGACAIAHQRRDVRLLDAEVDGVYAAGSTGEGMRMSLPDREALVSCLMSHLPKDKKLFAAN